MPDKIDPDPISRVLRRHHGIAGSPLERAIRLNAYRLIDTGDGTKTDAQLDEFVLDLRKDDFYSASFTTGAPPAKAAAGGIGIAITEEQRKAIDAGTLVIEAADNQETASIGPGTVQATEDEFKEIIASGKIRVG